MVPMPRCSAPSATTSSSPLVVMGLAVGTHRSNFMSPSQSPPYEVTDLVRGLRRGDRLGLAGAYRQRAEDLLSDEDDGAFGVEVGPEGAGRLAGEGELFEQSYHVEADHHE